MANQPIAFSEVDTREGRLAIASFLHARNACRVLCARVQSLSYGGMKRLIVVERIGAGIHSLLCNIQVRDRVARTAPNWPYSCNVWLYINSRLVNANEKRTDKWVCKIAYFLKMSKTTWSPSWRTTRAEGTKAWFYNALSTLTSATRRNETIDLCRLART